MKKVFWILALTGSVCVAGEQEKNWSDFTPEYLSKVQSERESERQSYETSMRDRREHDKFLRELARIDKRQPQ